ncbi:hypothetical protein NOR51B_1086 [Luminiphilus syltensis NOR5-1B]|uniref:Uncharacterized protein n=1 Tax=Luminiphilus syltensis NOR5-1B TaxID=565045 RepID=B8KTT8_9GAMM|nr:hypothetical protein [Luminiphilus syltensis]EED35141.1 hypothetical protein NOR51B_1086 [Luminiphilus syltensis NOR5-1B]
MVRGSQKGDSHGGIFLLDFENQKLDQVVDWNSGAIDFSGRGADRGLRGIAFDDERIFVAASDELFCYDPDFNVVGSWRNRYLKHAHEICRAGRKLFITSTGFDAVLVFDLDSEKFEWGFHLMGNPEQWQGFAFDPQDDQGPRPSNDQHINMVHVDRKGLFLSGLHTRAIVRVDNANRAQTLCSLPEGAHNARPFGDGIVFNDTQADRVRYVPRRGEQLAFIVPSYDPDTLEYKGVDDSSIARQAFGRGLCLLDERFIAAGSSPSTVSLYDIRSRDRVASVCMTMDIRNAIHGLEVWPFETAH